MSSVIVCVRAPLDPFLSSHRSCDSNVLRSCKGLSIPVFSRSGIWILIGNEREAARDKAGECYCGRVFVGALC